MLHKIDKLQSEVDSLRMLLDEAGVADGPELLSSEQKKRQRLYIMTLKIQEGEFPKRNINHFSRWLKSDQQALRDYVEFQHLCAALHTRYNQNKFQKAIHFLKECLTF